MPVIPKNKIAVGTAGAALALAATLVSAVPERDSVGARTMTAGARWRQDSITT